MRRGWIRWVLVPGLVACMRPAPPTARIPTATPGRTAPPSVAVRPSETPTPWISSPTPTIAPATATATQPPTSTPRPPQWAEIGEIAYSPDGRLMAVGTSGGVYLYDAATLEMVRYLDTSNSVASVAFSPDGSLLASVSSDRTVRLWRVADGALVHTLVVDK